MIMVECSYKQTQRMVECSYKQTYRMVECSYKQTKKQFLNKRLHIWISIVIAIHAQLRLLAQANPLYGKSILHTYMHRDLHTYINRDIQTYTADTSCLGKQFVEYVHHLHIHTQGHKQGHTQLRLLTTQRHTDRQPKLLTLANPLQDVSYTHTHARPHAHTHTHTHTHARSYTPTYTHMHRYRHTHTH